MTDGPDVPADPDAGAAFLTVKKDEMVDCLEPFMAECMEASAYKGPKGRGVGPPRHRTGVRRASTESRMVLASVLRLKTLAVRASGCIWRGLQSGGRATLFGVATVCDVAGLNDLCTSERPALFIAMHKSFHSDGHILHRGSLPGLKARIRAP